MDDYKIVNATELDADLESLANTLRAKNGESQAYVFPDDFNRAVADLYYDPQPNTADDISYNVTNRTIDVASGFYGAKTSFDLTDLSPEDSYTTPIVPGDNPITLVLKDTYCLNNITIKAVDTTNTYLKRSNVIPTNDPYISADGTEVIIPAGYYAEEKRVTIPSGSEEAPSV